MDAKLCFIDCETTSLRADRRAWEIGIITRNLGFAPDAPFHWFVDAQDLDLGNADPMALKIGGFYDRHPQYAVPQSQDEPGREFHVLQQVELVTRGAHLIGAVPSFDAELLGNRMREHGLAPSWHYHLIDIEALMIGVLRAYGQDIPLPWKSDVLSQTLGVEPTGEDERHTALGDARWAERVWDRVMGIGVAHEVVDDTTTEGDPEVAADDG
jgi:DNA polymerase III epsilon subunit-like protein